MVEKRTVVALGATLAGLAVAAGAFGAHALKEAVSPERLDVFDTAVRYQMMHALALLLVAALSDDRLERPLRFAATLFVTGIVLFSGSLYALVLADLPVLGAVTPLGGVLFLVGWGVVVAWSISRRRPPRTAG